MTTSRSGKPKYHCSFCGKSQEYVQRLIAGPGAVYICDECIRLCMDIIEEDNTMQADSISGTASNSYESVYRVVFDEAVETEPASVSGSTSQNPSHSLVGIIMGSRSDWATMQNAAETLE